MAKQKKRRGNKAGNRQVEQTPEAILIQAEQTLASGQLVRAREGFRRLFKIDSQVYRERFVETTLLAIDELLEVGKSGQVKQWLDYLENDLKVSSERLKISKLKLAGNTGDSEALAELYRMQFSSENEFERLQGADALVLAKAPEAEVIGKAISFLSQKEWSSIGEVLKAVGRKSPFAHWSLFLKGCAAFYQKQYDLAQACFSKLPDGTVPARKAKALGAWRRTEGLDPSGSEFNDACCLLGEAEIGEVILKSEDLWAKGRYLKVYETLRQKQNGFPSAEVNLAGQMTHLFQHAGSAMKHSDRDRWYEFITRTENLGRFKTPLDKYVFTGARIHSVGYEHHRVWDRYRKSRADVFGKNKHFNAMSYYAEVLQIYVLDCPCEDSMLGAHDIAIPYLEESLKEDPNFEPSYEKLLSAYKAKGETSKANKLRDTMCKQFPESEGALLEGGLGCMERKAFVKALGYLEKAKAIAPLNEEIADALRLCLQNKAVAHYAKGGAEQTEQGRETFERLLAEVGNSQREGFAIKSLVLILWSSIESFVKEGNARQKELQEKVIDIHPHVVEFIATAYKQRYLEDFVRWSKPLKSIAKIKGTKTLDQALQMLKFLFNIFGNASSEGAAESYSMVEEYMDRALAKLTKDDRETVIALYKLHEANPFFSDEYPEKLISKWLKKDKKDPLFLVWELEHDFGFPSQRRIANVRKIAEQRGDSEAIRALEIYLKEIGDEDEDDEPWGNEDFEESEDDDSDDIENCFEAIVLILKPMNPRERIRFLVDQGLPKADAQELSDEIDTMDSRTPNAYQPKSPIPKKKDKKAKKEAKKAKKEAKRAQNKVAKKQPAQPEVESTQGEFNF